ncbi:MAG TPA: helix-hairpin-helix domain-containing protein [Burkholderiaceae bacterium]|nr:helix-hairpin-helix domain-containing protein [Burkholderiaceae bacterium]
MSPARRREQAVATLLRGIVGSLLIAIGCRAQAAPVDANSATRAELESIKGVGPSISDGILEERRKRAFADWQDLIARVKGVGEGSAAKFSADGLTVNGVSYRGPSAVRNAGEAKTHPAARGPAAPTPAASAQQ